MAPKGVSAVSRIAPSTDHSSSRPTITTSYSSTQSIQREFHSQTLPTDVSSIPPRRQGLSPEIYALAEQVLLPQHEHLRQEKALLLSGGLRWLLESTAEAERNTTRRTSMSHGLTEAAARTLNRIEDGKKSFVNENEDQIPAGRNLKEGRRTEDWMPDFDA